jgi:hypothetical protein
MLILVLVVLDLIVLVNIVQNPMGGGEKVLWALIVLLLPLVGMLLYFAVGQKA